MRHLVDMASTRIGHKKNFAPGAWYPNL